MPVEPVAQDQGSSESARLAYPQTRRVDQVDEYHGVKVPDPYRWLEDLDAPETRAWVQAQNGVTFGYLESIEARSLLRERLRELWNYERYSAPSRVGDIYVLSRNDGLQDQSVLYTLESLDAEPRLLLDPNALSEDGTTALASVAFTSDGKLMAYGVSEAGSDWQVWRVRETQTAENRPDVIRWVKFSRPSWDKAGRGFFYARYDEPKGGGELEELNYDQKIFYHRLGTKQDEDRLVYARPDHKEWGFDPIVTEDGRYLVISVRIGTDPKNNLFYQDLGSKKPKTIELLSNFEASYHFVGNDGPVFYVQTDLDAPRQRLVAIDLRKPDKKNWKEIIGESEATLSSVRHVAGRFVASYLDNAHSKVALFQRDGVHEKDLELPGLGTASGFTGKPGHTETFYTFESTARPDTVYRYDFETGRSEVYKEPKLAFDPDDYEVRQVFYESADGTRVPMFLAHKKGVDPKGSMPTYLYGYGGFNIPLTPRFSVPNLMWMELGGLFAMPNLRGGGEFGEQWHQAGTKTNKQNVFDDFISAAEWLIANGYTNPDRLAIGGRSNGGLLVGATMAQRPELFAAALPGVGVMDMLRFNKFTIGWAWESDYGSPKNPDEFEALLGYSPYHNLREGTSYPATLVYTADHDDRVVPGHSYKFAAALQWAHRGDEPVLIRIDTKAGHGAGKPVSKQIEEWVDLWGFLVDNLDMQIPSVADGT